MIRYTATDISAFRALSPLALEDARTVDTDSCVYDYECDVPAEAVKRRTKGDRSV